MEYSLRHARLSNSVEGFNVLILILMEYSLRPLRKYAGKWSVVGLNPYSNGI